MDSFLCYPAEIQSLPPKYVWNLQNHRKPTLDQQMPNIAQGFQDLINDLQSTIKKLSVMTKYDGSFKLLPEIH